MNIHVRVKIRNVAKNNIPSAQKKPFLVKKHLMAIHVQF